MSETDALVLGWATAVCVGAAFAWRAPWFLLSAFILASAMFIALDNHRGEPAG